MIRGFDCYGVPNDTVLRRAVDREFRVICPYYGTPGSPKNLTSDSAKRISEAGLMIFPVFEITPGRALMGRAQGSIDAALAVTQARAAGQPPGTTICFAVDTDVDTGVEANRNALIDYFGGAKDTIGSSFRVAAYGSGDVLSLLLGVGLIEVSWLAGAAGWRGSGVFDRWDLRQWPTVRIGAVGNELGIEYDRNDIADLAKIGAWSLAPATAPVEPPEPAAVSHTGPIDLFALQRALSADGCDPGPIDGMVRDLTGRAGTTAAALIAYSRKHPPAA